MKILYLCLISGVNVAMALIQVDGYVGRSAVIRCPYDRGYVGYSKYLCRGKCIWGSKDIPIRTDDGQTKAINGRFSLHDDTTTGVFTVTITGLSAGDSGQYWCGITTGPGKYDIYTEVELNVKKGPPPTTNLKLPAPVVPRRTKVLTTPAVTIVSSTLPAVTDVSSTSTLVTTDYFACEDCRVNTAIKSQQPAISFNVVVVSGAAGLAVLLIIAVVLGCRAAKTKRKKSLETPDDTTLSLSALTTANIYRDTETTREVCSASWGNTPREIDPVYECLDMKECGPDAEYERMGALNSGRAPLARVNRSPGKDTRSISKAKKGLENEYESMRNTLSISKAKKGLENEYESLRDTHSISKASKGAENEYESLRNTISISKASKGAENEYESLRNTISISKASKGAENEYASMRGTLSIASKGTKNEHNPKKAALSKARRGAENEYMSLKVTLPGDVKSTGAEYEPMRDTLNRARE
ncbi:CMRF35-like molecule 1 isoform X3 [Alosa sapidissima]|uniref:CMRF35-like molecule 1 isoform X3 n=1 Tax=Alosa sapidissima TaxID=34773 RepID=UPI001C09A8E6|nr:CMRF35-like molecule 1 isoform X3 [Alosa sapidissima]